MPDLGRRLPALASAAVLVAALVAVLSLYRDYGVTWDEAVQARYGELVLDYVHSHGEDRSALEFLDLRYYGPLFESAAALLYAGDPDARYPRRHLAIGLVGLLTLVGVMGVARETGLPWLPPAAGLALLCLPRFFGHLFNNSKDVPFAAGFALALWALAALVARPGLPWRRVGLAGAAIGLAAALRPGGLPLLAAFLALALLAVLWRDGRADARAVGGALAKGGAALVLAWALMVATWPWAWEAPLAHPFEVMAQATDFAQKYGVLFRGREVRSDELPATYLVWFVAIATPPALLALAAVGLGSVGVRLRRDPRGPRSLVLALGAAWLVAPLAAFTVLRPNVYDGLRHALFALPGLALLGGVGACALASLAPAGRWRRLAGVALALTLAAPLPSLVRLHPYQADYFNAFVGGLAGAAGRYETDYWAASYKEAMEWLAARAAQEGPLHVQVAANGWSLACAETYAGPDVELETLFRQNVPGSLPDGIDYYVAITRYRLDRNYPAAPVRHRVEREGATLAVIKGRREPR